MPKLAHDSLKGEKIFFRASSRFKKRTEDAAKADGLSFGEWIRLAAAEKMERAGRRNGGRD